MLFYHSPASSWIHDSQNSSYRLEISIKGRQDEAQEESHFSVSELKFEEAILSTLEIHPKDAYRWLPDPPDPAHNE